MYQKQLINIGLTKVQAEILNFLLGNGEFKASELATKIKRPRGVVYKGLEELASLGLVEKKIIANQISRFRAEHPTKLEKILEQKEKNLQQNKKLFAEILPDLTSTYNLSLNKPGVKFYEGDEGIKKVLFDTLKSKTEIYTFVDIKAVQENLAEINKEYVKKREKAGIKKKIIVADTEENKNFFKNYNKEITDIKFLKKEFYPFQTGMQIYDNKISYQTLTKDNQIAVMIEDKNIFKMHKLFFEYIWESLDGD